MLHGRSVPQYPDQAFAAAGVHFNVLIAPREQSLLGYAETGCYGTDSQGAVEVCVFRRPGGCV
jgi:hypothetical protein